ncbi:MAG: SusD/RagB family nutrient-binding outer membrane lipoprotein [Ferruginibacter sp.]|nr:SusD/RagB family nutrient-binding outer membrane lipoprotein [Ferruginibacter sp.]
MKNISIKKITTAGLIALTLVGPGCAKISEFGTTNNNPNGINQPVTSALFTQVMVQLDDFAANVRRGVYAQYLSENQYTETSLYALPLLEMGGTYSGALQDMQTIINTSTNANQIAVAKILKSYIFWTVTDAWGDIPYSEALQGAGNLTPKFDKQEDVYFGLLKDLKDAVNGFDAGQTPGGDIVYGGLTNNDDRILAWRKLGNSIRMLMAMRLTNKYPAAGGKAAIEFADAAAGPHITTNAENAVINPSATFQNPWYLVYQTRDDYASSKTMGDVLSGLGDSRSTVFGTPGPTFPYGLTRDLAIAYGNSVGNNQSRVLATSFRQPTSPVVVIPASLVLLVRAEAKERGWIAGGTAGAEADYNAAITASYAQWGLTVPAGYLTGAASYASGAGVPGSIGAGTAPYDNYRAADNNIQDAATGDKLKRIALQYWIAAFPNGNEGWSNQRRTGVPNFKETRFKTGPFVTRYVYGNNDYGLNNANTAAAAAAIGGDKQDTKVWWDN